MQDLGILILVSHFPFSSKSRGAKTEWGHCQRSTLESGIAEVFECGPPTNGARWGLPDIRSACYHCSVSEHANKPTFPSFIERNIHFVDTPVIDTVDLPLHSRTNASTYQTCKVPILFLLWELVSSLITNLRPRNRVFVLGPSHHVYLDGCALSRCDTYETPLGDLQLDRERKGRKGGYGRSAYKKELIPWYGYTVINSLYETGHFEWMSKTVDEDEHSIEMQLPFTAKIFAE